ncbi:hypothetical protein ACO2I3_05080 [Leptospira interrogans]
MAKSARSKVESTKTSKTKSAKVTKSVASASPQTGRRKKMHGTTNQTLVERYALELQNVMGDRAFEDVFRRLKDDANIYQREAVAIASLLLQAKVSESTARGTALGRILKLHNSLLTFKLKQRAVGGRSAA